MEISPLQRQVQVKDIPLTQLAANSQISEQEKVTELSRQFEAVLVRKILSDGQKPLFKADLTQSSASSEIYRDMVTTQMADRISSSGGFGLANALKHQLSRQTLSTSSAPDASATDKIGGK